MRRFFNLKIALNLTAGIEEFSFDVDRKSTAGIIHSFGMPLHQLQER